MAWTQKSEKKREAIKTVRYRGNKRRRTRQFGVSDFTAACSCCFWPLSLGLRSEESLCIVISM